jgi:translocation and assembly module TamA
MAIFFQFSAGFALLVFASSVFAEARLQVRVEPANSALERNIEGHIGSLGERDSEALQRYRRAAELQARNAVQALGYYHAQISSKVGSGKKPSLTIEVKAGEPVHLRNVTLRIEGPASQLQAFQLPDDPQLRSGAQLNHGRYDAARLSIQNQAARLGFFSGRFTRRQLNIDPESGTADIQLIFDSGPRYQLEAVQFVGDLQLQEQLLQRMLPFKSTTPYDSDLIVKLSQALNSSGYFESVLIDVNPNRAVAEVIPVKVQLQMRKPRSLGLGVGYSTDVGPRARASWMRHWANAAGHSYGAEMEVSEPRQVLGLWYDIPLDPPLTDKLRLGASYEFDHIADNDVDSRLLSLGPEWHSQLESGWLRIISLKWQHEEYDLGGQAGNSNLLMPGVSYALLNSDNPIDPSHGYRLQFDLAGAGENLGSDTTLWHGNVLYRGLTTVARKHRFLGRAQLGATEGSALYNVPPSLRFFAGGDQSVRGYDYQSLAPEDRSGRRIGGRYLAAGSLEYQYGIAEQWRLASFVDRGNSFDSLDQPELKRAVGLGVRWISPVGPIRVDLARALDDGGGLRLHFSMGPEL